MTEDETEKPIIDTEQQRLIERSLRLIQKTKNHITNLRRDIENQEEILTRQRIELNKLLEDLGINHD